MSERKQGKSIGLVSSALLASVAMMPQLASADPGSAGPLTFIGAWDNATPFGTVVDAFIETDHIFGTGPQTVGSYFGYTTSVAISSNLSQRPGYEYDFTVDWTNAHLDPNLYAGYNKITFYLGYIKAPGTANPVTQFTVKNALGVEVAWTPVAGGSDGTYIFLQVNMADITLDALTPDLMTVQWRQDPVPAPGALALLGIGGLVGTRRRRR